MRIEQRIVVFESHDQADRDAAVAHGIQPAAAEFLLAQRIAQRVNDGARLQAILRDVPEFLDADRVLRRPGGAANLQVAMELLGQVAADTVSKDRDLGVNVGAGLERAFRLAVLA